MEQPEETEFVDNFFNESNDTEYGQQELKKRKQEEAEQGEGQSQENQKEDKASSEDQSKEDKKNNNVEAEEKNNENNDNNEKDDQIDFGSDESFEEDAEKEDPQATDSDSDDENPKKRKKSKRSKKEKKKKKKEKKEKGEGKKKKERKEGEGKKKKKKDREEEETPESDDEDTKIRKEIDEALKNARKKLTRKKSDLMNDHQFTDKMGDFVGEMIKAVSADLECYRKKQPALNRLAILSKVKDTLKKATYHEVLISQDVLTAIRKWLEPFPDGTLPNTNIRTTILQCLSGFPPLNREDLVNSNIGRIVMHLKNHDKETTANKAICKALIEMWSRPIFGIRRDYNDLQGRAQETLASQEVNEELNEQRARLKLLEEKTRESLKGVERSHPTIPQKMSIEFTSVPQAPQELKSLRANQKRNPIEKVINNSKRSGSKPQDRISVEGRNLFTNVHD